MVFATNWQISLKETSGFIMGLSCCDSLNCICSKEQNTLNSSSYLLKKTSDGGKTWGTIFKLTYPGKSLKFNDISYFSKKTCLVACDSGIILKSTDDDSIWQRIRISDTVKIKNIFMINDFTGFLLTEIRKPANYFYTTDGGYSWIKRFFPDSLKNEYINDFSTPDSCSIFFLCDTEYGFSLIKTDIIRNSWEKIPLPLNTWYIEFINKLEGWALNSYTRFNVKFSYINYTTDGGITWKEQLSAKGKLWGDIEMFDEKHGFVCGHPQVLYYTSDGGLNWIEDDTPAPLNNAINFVKVCPVSQRKAFARGASGAQAIWKYSEDITDVMDEGHNENKSGIYPNPVTPTDNFTLKLNTDLNILEIGLINSMGNIINKITYLKFNKAGENIDLKEIISNIPLVTGTYFLAIISPAKTITIPFILLNNQ